MESTLSYSGAVLWNSLPKEISIVPKCYRGCNIFFLSPGLTLCRSDVILRGTILTQHFALNLLSPDSTRT